MNYEVVVMVGLAVLSGISGAVCDSGFLRHWPIRHANALFAASALMASALLWAAQSHAIARFWWHLF